MSGIRATQPLLQLFHFPKAAISNERVHLCANEALWTRPGSGLGLARGRCGRHLFWFPIPSALFPMSPHSRQRAIFAEDKSDDVSPQLRALQ